MIQPLITVPVGGTHSGPRNPLGYVLIGARLALLAVLLVIAVSRVVSAERRYLWAIIPGAILGGALLYWLAVAVSRAAQAYMGG